MAGQRQLALRALAGVVRGRAACIARGKTPPHPRLPEMLPVAIRYVAVAVTIARMVYSTMVFPLGIAIGYFYPEDLPLVG